MINFNKKNKQDYKLFKTSAPVLGLFLVMIAVSIYSNVQPTYQSNEGFLLGGLGKLFKGLIDAFNSLPPGAKLGIVVGICVASGLFGGSILLGTTLSFVPTMTSLFTDTPLGQKIRDSVGHDTYDKVKFWVDFGATACLIVTFGLGFYKSGIFGVAKYGIQRVQWLSALDSGLGITFTLSDNLKMIQDACKKNGYKDYETESKYNDDNANFASKTLGLALGMVLLFGAARQISGPTFNKLAQLNGKGEEVYQTSLNIKHVLSKSEMNELIENVSLGAAQNISDAVIRTLQQGIKEIRENWDTYETKWDDFQRNSADFEQKLVDRGQSRETYNKLVQSETEYVEKTSSERELYYIPKDLSGGNWDEIEKIKKENPKDYEVTQELMNNIRDTGFYETIDSFNGLTDIPTYSPRAKVDMSIYELKNKMDKNLIYLPKEKAAVLYNPVNHNALYLNHNGVADIIRIEPQFFTYLSLYEDIKGDNITTAKSITLDNLKQELQSLANDYKKNQDVAPEDYKKLIFDIQIAKEAKVIPADSLNAFQEEVTTFIKENRLYGYLEDLYTESNSALGQILGFYNLHPDQGQYEKEKQQYKRKLARLINSENNALGRLAADYHAFILNNTNTLYKDIDNGSVNFDLFTEEYNKEATDYKLFKGFESSLDIKFVLQVPKGYDTEWWN